MSWRQRIVVKEKSEVAGSEDLQLGYIRQTREEKSKGELMKMN